MKIILWIGTLIAIWLLQTCKLKKVEKRQAEKPTFVPLLDVNSWQGEQDNVDIRLGKIKNID